MPRGRSLLTTLLLLLPKKAGRSEELPDDTLDDIDDDDRFLFQRPLRFYYPRRDGSVDLRSVWDWTDEGDRFTGTCIMVDAERTFLKSKVATWLEGDEQLR